MSKNERFKEIERFRKDQDSCMKCGFCISACPVYKEELVESAVARGKNALVGGLLTGELEFSPAMEKRLDKCTLCQTCTANCPAGVKIPSVIVAARADKFRSRGLKFPYNFIYRSLLPRRVLFGRVVKAVGLAQKAFFPRAEGTLRHLPLFLTGLGKGRHLPQLASRFLRQSVPVVNKPANGLAGQITGVGFEPARPGGGGQGASLSSRTVGATPQIETSRRVGETHQNPTVAQASLPVVKLRVGYLTGCMTEYVFPELGKKVIDFLTGNGVEVIVPREQGCCGAPVFLGAGDFETGRKLADTNAKAFQDLEYVIVDCATCGSAIQDYVKYLADTDERRKAYLELGKKIIHITAFLVDILKLPASAYQAVNEVKGKTVTWHDPCHLSRHMGVREQPRQILKSIADIKYVEMADADRCCGMAGAFSLKFYELSTKIAERKIKNILESGADIVVSGCPGCQIQLMDALARGHHPVKVMHIMDLLEPPVIARPSDS